MNRIILTFENFLKRTNYFFRFILVGVINTCIGLGVIFILMNGFQLNYWVSTFTGNAAGAVVSFILNRNFTFKSKASLGKGGLRFVAVILICYFFSYSFSDQITKWALHDFDLPIYLSLKDVSVILGSIFYTVSNFFGQKYFVFTDRKTTEVLS